ncbi:MAG: type II toxin-antitoxin system HicB family antitoxin [Candidatus Eremiobacteraeota bacterium]|nr:type II toxin-antitoxin system HicB family antitoxin [Candidatus Eremiobacteraeota bacterium]
MSVPDLPGCFAVGRSAAAVEKRIRDTIAFHIEGLRVSGPSDHPP